MNSNKTELRLKTTSEKLDAQIEAELLRNEARLGNREAFEHYLNAVPDVSPQDDDRLEN